MGICVFCSPAASLSLRTRYFNLSNPRGEASLDALNRQLWCLSRVVLHPTYRGLGVAAPFVRRACELCPVDWVETLTVLGQTNPFFERAGFVRVGQIRKSPGQGTRSGAYGTRKRRAAQRDGKGEGADLGEPVYLVFDNRGRDRADERAKAQG